MTPRGPTAPRARACRSAVALAACALAASCGCGDQRFGSDFLFGAAVAGFQVDPGCPTLPAAQCEDRGSDWYQFVTSSAELADLEGVVTFEPLANGPGHWELYERDFELARRELGLDAFRLSIEWSRVFPTPTDGLTGDALAGAANQEALAHYHAVFAALRARNLEPLVTLNHYTLPLWLHDGVACHKDVARCTRKGWLDRARALSEIEKYAGFVAKEFGGEVDLWVTLNEPYALVLPGYLLPTAERSNPPALFFRYEESRQVTVALIEAHARMYDAVRAGDGVDADGDGEAARIGLVYPVAPTHPVDPQSRLDVRGAQNLYYLYCTVFLDGVVKGLVDGDLDGHPDTAEPRADLVGRMDFLGLNYYTQMRVKGTGAPAFPSLSPLTTFDITSVELVYDDPKGIYTALLDLTARYQLPIIVTETSVAITDDEGAGARWLVQHLQWARRAMRDGADLRGFFYWSLMDNYEWNLGTGVKYGLYSVARDAERTRAPRPAVEAYRAVTRAREVTQPWAQRYPVAAQ